MYNRPKRNETEEDLLRMQEEYLKHKSDGKVEAAAKAVDCRKKESVYAKTKGLKRVKFEDKPSTSKAVLGDVVEKKTHEDDSVYFPTVKCGVLGAIVERSTPKNDFTLKPVNLSGSGFPKATMRDKTVAKTATESIFAQQVCNVKSQSRTVTGDDAEQIHNENVELLNNYSEAEILDEKRRLESSIDPALLQFLRSKRQRSEKPMEIEQVDKVADDLPQDIWENEILSHPDLEKWLNFDRFEKEKLKWLESMNDKPKNSIDEPYEARFDLKGWLLPYSMEYTEESKVLFHHGEESHRPGYTVAELFDLTRSLVIQQKTIALNALAGILEFHNIGAYRDVIELPVTKMFFVLRFALDDNKLTTLEPTLKALRNLLYNRIDEACLDASFVIDKKQPNLSKDKSEIAELSTDESELKDFHLTDIDLIAGALRTDLHKRIKYILNVLKPNFICVQYCLQILTRFARDSNEAVQILMNEDCLVTSIVRDFIPATSVHLEFNPSTVYGLPVIAAVKFARILASHSADIARFFVERCSILNSVTAYLTVRAETLHALRLQIESLQLYSVLLDYGYGAAEFVAMYPILITAIDRHVSATDVSTLTPLITIGHASALFSVLSSALKTHDERAVKEIKSNCNVIFNALRKWIIQIAHLNVFTSGYASLPSSVFKCAADLHPDTNIDSAFRTLFNSDTFHSMIKELTNSSNLLSGLTSTVNVSSIFDLNASLLSSPQKVLPSISLKSPIQFISSLLHFLRFNKIESGITLWEHLRDYITVIVNRKTFALQDNWFTRSEITLLVNFVAFSRVVSLNDTQKDLVFLLSHKLVSLLSNEFVDELRAIFREIIFDKRWFSAERLIKHLSMSVAHGTINELGNICRFYFAALNLDRVLEPRDLKLSWKSTVLPKDWIYVPIVALYSKSHELQSENECAYDKIAIIKYALQWVTFSEIYFPEQMGDIAITDRFCRIMCIFLCDNSLFLDAGIKPLLKNCLLILYKLEKETVFNFDGKLEGMSNFVDFYTQFADHFQAVSYGDENFASCLLVPLSQRHDVKWKKILWSEYAGCLRALDCPIESLCYSLEEYLYPEETDASLLKCYHRALQGNLLRIGTLPHQIASHHVQKAMLRAKSARSNV